MERKFCCYKGKIMDFSTLLVTCMVRLMQHLAAAVPGSLDPLRGQSASAQSPHWGQTMATLCLALGAVSSQWD